MTSHVEVLTSRLTEMVATLLHICPLQIKICERRAVRKEVDGVTLGDGFLSSATEG